MRIKVGDRIEYWHGLGGVYLREGVVKRIELESAVAELEVTDEPWFIDLEDGRWTYAPRVVRVLAPE